MSRKMMPLVLVLAIPLLASAQGPRGHGGGPGRPSSSLELLLKNQEALALTAEQAAQVEALQAALEQKNAPILEKLEALRPPRPPPDSEEMRARRQQVEPLITELRANDDAAYQEAELLLSDTQKARARELITQVREEHQRRREAMHQRMQNRQ
ncbi:hypothetical protein NR798_41730 [Archangium gephyra]|uniref:hypothetical protein n=1 Tax=Archangium gephyra TaxID=48 RepID=UPI0035D4A34E